MTADHDQPGAAAGGSHSADGKGVASKAKGSDAKPAAKKRGRKPTKPKLPTVTPKRPSWVAYATEVQTEKGHPLKPGLYFHGIKDDAETDTFICSPLEVLAITSDENGENYGRLLRLLPKGALRWREWAAPMEMLAGDGSELRRVLLSLGVTIPNKQRQALADYLMGHTPPRTVTAATRTGWLSPSVFVMPRQVIGSADVVFQSVEAGAHDYAKGGELAAWQAEVAALCVGNPSMILGMCAALAGPLLSPLGVPGVASTCWVTAPAARAPALKQGAACGAGQTTTNGHGTPPAPGLKAWPPRAMTPCWCWMKSARPTPTTSGESSTPWVTAPAASAAR